MNQNELLALADRVEREASRELDLYIVCTLDRRPEWLAQSQGQMWVDGSGLHPVIRWADDRIGKSLGNPGVDDPPPFTRSLDAAMTLVPKGYDVALGTGRPAAIPPAARIPWAWVARGGALVDDTTTAATPAQALTAACLRALATQGDA